ADGTPASARRFPAASNSEKIAVPPNLPELGITVAKTLTSVPAPSEIRRRVPFGGRENEKEFDAAVWPFSSVIVNVIGEPGAAGFELSAENETTPLIGVVPGFVRSIVVFQTTL